VNAPLPVARCHSYIWKFTFLTLIFNNINLLKLIITKNWWKNDGENKMIAFGFWRSFGIKIILSNLN
jgi:hypothetical protein